MSPIKFVFLFGHLPIYTVQTYTYIGIVFDEHLTFSECIKTRTDAAGRALGGLISKCQKLKGLGYDFYCKLDDSCTSSRLRGRNLEHCKFKKQLKKFMKEQ